MSHAMTYWSISSQELCKEAKKLWLTVDIVSKEKNLFYISDGTQETLFKSTDFWGNSSLGFKLCKDKWLTYDILERHNLPIAKSVYISKTKPNDLYKIDISQLKMPLIIKPLSEWHGNWVMMCITSVKELHTKLTESFMLYSDMIIQEQIEGDEVRVIVVRWEVVLAYKRIPASVIWDNVHSIRDLISIENKCNPLRWIWYESPLVYIEIDDELKSYIWKQELDLNNIPRKGELIQLRWNSNTGTWWTMENVTDTLHLSTKKNCIEAANLLGLKISGVDIIVWDISQDLEKQWWIILEVNATPWIGGDKEATWINSAHEILKRVFNLKNMS